MAGRKTIEIVAVLTVLSLAACASRNVPSNPTSTAPYTAGASFTPSVAPEPTIAPATPSPSPIPFLAPLGPPCTAAQLEVRRGGSFGALGNGITYLIFTDRGTKPCTLRGTPDVQLFDNSGRLLAIPRLEDSTLAYIPTFPNNGVGLVALASEGVAPGPNPEGGIRGQASLPLQYYDDGCGNDNVAALRIRVGGGIFTVRLSIPGGGPGCDMPSQVSVDPFQPAEFFP